MRGRVCLLYMLLSLASAVFLGSEPLGTRNHILLSQIRDFFFIASYDSQGHGGSIRPRLHTGQSQNQSHFTTDGQSVSRSWCRAHLGLMTRYLVLFDSYGRFFCGALSLTRGRVCLLSESLPALVSHLL
jgi:hypothetical protein